MKRFFFLGLILLLSSNQSAGSTNLETKIVTLGVLDIRSKTDFESQILPYLQEQVKNCNRCEVLNLISYNEKGDY